MKDNFIQQRVIQHKNELLEAGYEEDHLLGIFAYGSMNYGTYIPDKSDVDTKAIFIPTLEQLLNNSFKVHTKILSSGEHCEIMDIGHLVKNFRKQNINFLELLYTEYYWINPMYEKLWNKYFIKQKEEISRYDINKGVSSIAGQIIHTLKQDPTNGKKVGNGLRLYYFLTSYVAGKPWGECLKPSNELIEKILSIKYSTLQDSTQAEVLINLIESIKEVQPKGDIYNKENIDSRMIEGMKKMVRKLDRYD